MLIDKIIYYIKTDKKKRDADLAEFNALNRKLANMKKLCKQRRDELQGNSESGAPACIMRIPYRMDEYLQDSLNACLPIIVRNDYCPFFAPQKANGFCGRVSCACHEKNHAFFLARGRLRELMRTVDNFWAKKYSRVR